MYIYLSTLIRGTPFSCSFIGAYISTLIMPILNLLKNETLLGACKVKKEMIA